MITKTIELHVLPYMESTTIEFANVDCQMFGSGIITFDLAMNYLDENQTPRHATIGLFEVHETSSGAMALQLQSLLENFG